jgi:cold shock CspA family protein
MTPSKTSFHSDSDRSGNDRRCSGVVQRLLPERGYGFIRALDGEQAGIDFFFHLSGLRGCSINDLSLGDLVRFEPQMKAKGPRAEAIERVLA